MALPPPPAFDAKAAAQALMSAPTSGLDVVAPSSTHLTDNIQVTRTNPGTLHEVRTATLSGTGPVHTGIESAKSYGASLGALPEASLTKGHLDMRESLGVQAQHGLNMLEKHGHDSVAQLTAVQHELHLERINEVAKGASASATEIAKIDAALKATVAHQKTLAELQGDAVGIIAKARPEVEAATKISSGVSATVAKTGATVEKAAATVATAEKAAAWKGAGTFGKMKMNAAENWKSSSGMGKAGRAAGTAVGVILGVKGAADLGRFVGVVSPKTDDQGKEIPVDAGTLVKSAAELGGAALALHYSLTKAPAIFKGMH